MLEAQDITHGYGGKHCLSGVSLTVAPGEIVGLSGHSGAGKSTLGKIIAGALPPQRGRVTLDGAPYAGPRAGAVAPVQYAPQVSETAVDPRWTIRKLLANGGDVPEATLAAFGVERSWLDRKPAEISGGQLARVSLARLFLPPVRIVVCDEVSAHLDALSAIELLTELRRFAVDRGIGILMISHSKLLLRRFADRAFALDAGRLLPES